jgi:hypothetical protein
MFDFFFFHVVNGPVFFQDREGAEYLNFDVAKSYAQRLARELQYNKNFEGFEILIADAAGRELCRMPVNNKAAPSAVRR